MLVMNWSSTSRAAPTALAELKAEQEFHALLSGES